MGAALNMQTQHFLALALQGRVFFTQAFVALGDLGRLFGEDLFALGDLAFEPLQIRAPFP